ncbi:hypothetical protein SPRG_20338 [Saprolegnia parasitica CBS 223.65]|uniref:EF-hand domain-containing protein n=1 Tax=Saprolegnia parasitica (strain CBS 223.65) TaxID=695850 RepID=A0A067CAG3_SAPPC|nr:hypothetical protein SPRG_20338 [Saprolegnia parasitica CBS 223.65]KDO27498.1 hypothetical protein SPRG_20338 [Saprolegnia parasitica CBS 223.65]|eukprot:XP_012201948.1 hypothetical protein SPRG_20338 [Saprolegnia parasitica CBS 223.65]
MTSTRCPREMAASPHRMPLVQKQKRVHVGTTNLLRASSSPLLPTPKLSGLSGAIYGREPAMSPPTPVARARTPTPLQPRPHTTANAPQPAPRTPAIDKTNPVTQALFVKNRNKLRARVATRFGSMRAMFRAFDESGSGNITFEQFHKSISFLGLDMAEDDQRLLYQMVDTNGNNLIDFAEFSEMFEAEPMLKSFESTTAALKTRPPPLAVTPRTKARIAAFQFELSEKLLTKHVSQQVAYGSTSKVLLNAFRHMDHDGDGSLTYDELKAALGHGMLDLDMDPIELDAMIATIDADQNGYVSFKEFINYFSSQPEGADRDLFLHGRQRELTQLEARAKTVPSPRPIFEDLDGPVPVVAPVKLRDVESLPGCLPEQLCKRTSALVLSPPKPDTALSTSASVPEDLSAYFATLGPVVPPRSRHRKEVTDWSRVGVGGAWPANESPAYLPPEDRFKTTNMEQFSPEKSARAGLPEADLQRAKARLAARHERTYHNILRMQHNAEFRAKHASWEEKARVRAKSHQRLVYSSGVLERDEKQFDHSTRMPKKAGGASYHRMWAGSLESQFNTQPWGVLPPEKT